MNWEILLLFIYPEEIKNYLYLKTHWSHNKQDGESISPNREDMKSTIFHTYPRIYAWIREMYMRIIFSYENTIICSEMARTGGYYAEDHRKMNVACSHAIWRVNQWLQSSRDCTNARVCWEYSRAVQWYSWVRVLVE